MGADRNDLYVMRQASRRSWRIGQHQPVEATHLAYGETLQAEALALVAAKMRSALMIEGELPEDGLAALDGDGQDMLLALARRLTEERSDDGQSLEALFAQGREADVEGDDYLTAGDWNAGVVSPTLTGDDGGILDPSGCALTHATPADGVASGSDAAIAGSRVVSFTDLSRLIRRPRSRRKAVSEAQLELFEE